MDMDDIKRGREESEQVSLPELYAPKSGRHGLAVTVAVLFALALALCVFSAIALGTKEREPVEVDLPSETEEEWRGAFDSRETYAGALECSVALHSADGREDDYRSGVIVSEDGWIATSEGALGDICGGRIYVRLCDGREYVVEGVIRGEGASAVKIDAAGLCAAELADGEPQDGEEIFAVSGGLGVLKGIATWRGEAEVRLDMPLCKAEDGAPLFNSEGGLVGLAVYGEDRAQALRRESVSRLLESVIGEK